MTHVTTPALSVGSVTIRAHDGLYSLNDLHRASGGEDKHQPAKFIRLDTTQALIAELCSPDVANMQGVQICTSKCLDIVRGRGRPQGTYACKQLVIAYAAWISAAFQLKVINVFLNAVAPAVTVTPAPDDSRTEKAYALAQQTASMVSDKVFKAAASGRYNFSDGRWQILVSRCGTQVSLIDPNAAILTPAQFINGMRTGDVGSLWTAHDLMQLVQVTMQRLQHQLDTQDALRFAKLRETKPVQLPQPTEGHQAS